MARRGLLSLPRFIPFRRPGESSPAPSASDRLKEVTRQPEQQVGPPEETSATRLGQFIERRREGERVSQGGSGASTETAAPLSSAQRLRTFVEERQLAQAQALDRADQMEQLQTAALQARLGELLGSSPSEVSEAEGEEGSRLKRLDMRSELLVRRIAILLKKQSPKVGMS